jgi:hypothetical protein
MRLTMLIHRSRAAAGLDQELRDHVERQIQENRPPSRDLPQVSTNDKSADSSSSLEGVTLAADF